MFADYIAFMCCVALRRNSNICLTHH